MDTEHAGEERRDKSDRRWWRERLPGTRHRFVGGGGSSNLTPRYGSLTRRKPGIIDLTYIYILHKDSESLS